MILVNLLNPILDKVENKMTTFYLRDEYDLSYTNLSNLDLSDSRYIRCDMRGVNLSDSTLQEATIQLSNLKGANLRGADLRGADLTDANLEGIITDDYTR